MATKDEPTRRRINNVKADLRTTSTCTAATVATLQDLLFKKSEEPAQKENVKVKAQAAARRRAATAGTTSSVDAAEGSASSLSPRDKYILATEVANTTLKNLADALKSPTNTPSQRPASQSKTTPTEDARRQARSRTGHTKSASVAKRPLKERSVSQMNNSPQKPAIRRSSSYSSFLATSPDDGLVSTAECARIAFAYLGTPEATKVLGKDSQELQLESGILALIGKLVALGLDGLAVKEMRHLKKRLDKHLGQDNEVQRPASRVAEKVPPRTAPGEKESLAALLDFATVAPDSPALPLVVNLQTYALRVIAKLSRPRIVEACWDHLKLSNPSSVANLIRHIATTPNGQAKAARQLESLAQTILSLCPHISSTHDDKPLQPSPDIVLFLQHLAFKVRKNWWPLAKHQGDEERELLEPFTKCLIAFARRSTLPPSKKYKMAESLYTDLMSKQQGATESKTLSALAQAAGLSEEALRWLGSAQPIPSSTAPGSKQSARLVRIATVTLEAFIKDDLTPGLDGTVQNALEALKGSLSGTSSDLDALFLEVNTFRRAATRLLISRSSTPKNDSERTPVEKQAFAIIAASVHFSARMVGAKSPEDGDAKARQRHNERMIVVSKCVKSTIDSVLTCCKGNILDETQWQELDVMLQECSHILHRLEEDLELGAEPDSFDQDLVNTLTVKLSNAYWAVSIQLRKAKLGAELIVAAMQRSVNLVQTRSQDIKGAAHLAMKLEPLGDTLESLDSAEKSRKAFTLCIQAHLDSETSDTLSSYAATKSLQEIFANEGPLSTFARVLKSHHRGFLKSGVSDAKELAFFDHLDLEPGIRGVLLEWQLTLYIRTLSKNRNWDSGLNSSLAILVERLRELYAQEQYPIRRLRMLSYLLQLSQSHLDVVSTQSVLSDVSAATGVEIAGSEDEGLSRFGPHFKALHMLKGSMQQATPVTSTLRECFAAWESMVDTSTSWSRLIDRVEDTESWISDMKASVEFLNAKGEEYLALPVLRLLVRISELQKDPDTSERVTDLSALGLQFLRLGYTGKAGLSLAKAETLLTQQTASTESRLRWHIVYAEYLARIGNIAKGVAVMTAAQKLALADQSFMDLTKPSTTLSGRMRFNRVLADAAYVHSLLSSIAGSYKDAARHARQCVALNRRIWAALESRASLKKAASADVSESDVDGPSKAAFDPLSSMRNDKGTLLVMSITHDALSGAEFWSLVPALYRGLMQHSQIFAHQGLLQEAIYVAEQAEKVASATKSPTLMTDNASWRADCWAQSGRPDKAQPILDALASDTTRKCLSVVGYQSAVARVHHWNGQYEEELASYGKLNQMLQDLTSPIYIKTLETISTNVDSLVEQMAQMTVDAVVTPPVKVVTTTRGRKPAVKSTKGITPKTISKPAPKTRSRVTTTKAAPISKTKSGTSQATEAIGSIDQCSILHNFQAELIHRQVLANLLQEDVAAASALLARLEEGKDNMARDQSHLWATFKTMLAQSVKQIAENITVNTLPESTIAFPAINLKERRLSEDVTTKRAAPASSATAKAGRAKKAVKEDFSETLRNARDRLVEAHAACASKGPNYMFQQVSMALGTITVLLSAVSGGELGGSLHPLYAAYMGGKYTARLIVKAKTNKKQRFPSATHSGSCRSQSKPKRSKCRATNVCDGPSHLAQTSLSQRYPTSKRNTSTSFQRHGQLYPLP
jgi:separase